MRLTFSQTDGPDIRARGQRMLKLPNPVFMQGPIPEPFDVVTNEGTLSGQAGDYVAHDPITGHVWPVAASYVDQHYRSAPPEEPAARTTA